MRVARGASVAITSPIVTSLDEEPAEADTLPTVSVVGAVAGPLAAPTVEPVTGETGLYRAVLPAATYATALDRLTFTWTAVVDSQTSTYGQTVDVVGGHYASIPDLRAHPDTSTGPGSVARPVALLRGWRDSFANLVERYRGASWVPRLGVYEGRGADFHLRRHVQDIHSVTVGGDPISIDGWELSPSNVLHIPDLDAGDAWRSQIRVVYTYGLDTGVLECLTAACCEYVREAVMAPNSGISRNALSWADASGVTFRLSSADWLRGRPTGLTTVDRLLNEAPNFRTPGIG